MGDGVWVRSFLASSSLLQPCVSDAAIAMAPCAENAPSHRTHRYTEETTKLWHTSVPKGEGGSPGPWPQAGPSAPTIIHFHTLVPKSGLQHSGRETTALINKHFSLPPQLSKSQKPPRVSNLYSWNSLPDTLEGYDSISSVFPLSYLYINSHDDALYKWFC